MGSRTTASNITASNTTAGNTTAGNTTATKIAASKIAASKGSSNRRSKKGQVRAAPSSATSAASTLTTSTATRVAKVPRASAAEGANRTDRRATGDTWTLRLYVAGDSPKSRAAISNLKRLCETHLAGKYEIEVIDLKTRPELAKAHQILALPTLIRKVPEPVKRVIGDLSNADRTLVGLEIAEA